MHKIGAKKRSAQTNVNTTTLGTTNQISTNALEQKKITKPRKRNPNIIHKQGGFHGIVVPDSSSDEDDFEAKYIVSGPSAPVKFKSGHPSRNNVKSSSQNNNTATYKEFNKTVQPSSIN